MFFLFLLIFGAHPTSSDCLKHLKIDHHEQKNYFSIHLNILLDLLNKDTEIIDLHFSISENIESEIIIEDFFSLFNWKYPILPVLPKISDYLFEWPYIHKCISIIFWEEDESNMVEMKIVQEFTLDNF